MNTTLINAILESLNIFDIADVLRNNKTKEEELLNLWNKYNDDNKIYTIDILNTALSSQFTEAIKELHPTFNVRDRYCYHNGTYWVTFRNLYDCPSSPFSFHSLACSLKPDFVKYLREGGYLND